MPCGDSAPRVPSFSNSGPPFLEYSSGIVRVTPAWVDPGSPEPPTTALGRIREELACPAQRAPGLPPVAPCASQSSLCRCVLPPCFPQVPSAQETLGIQSPPDAPFSLSLLPSSPRFGDLLALPRLEVPSLCPQPPECRRPWTNVCFPFPIPLSSSGNIHFLNHPHHFPILPRAGAPTALASFPKPGLLSHRRWHVGHRRSRPRGPASLTPLLLGLPSPRGKRSVGPGTPPPGTAGLLGLSWE